MLAGAFWSIDPKEKINPARGAHHLLLHLSKQHENSATTRSGEPRYGCD
jgi:hypothetical protein